MATLYNQNGTNAAEILDFTVDGTYHAKGGNDTINIKGGNVIVYTDSGNNTINVTGGRGHTIKVAADDKESDKGYGVEKLTIDGADAVEAYLGAGNDEIVLDNTNGRKTSGASSAIHGGAWSDTFTVKAGARNYQLYGDAGNDTFNISGGSNMNFWGGAANDTFNVTGGTNNKLYGGDSADTFNISAGSQNLILGYGKDVVNITSGDKQQIKANLGINTINLKAGSGHVITADIDRAASKKKGYTDEQIDAGQGVGYGQDKVYISGTASEVTVHLGDGRDYVSVSSGSGHEIYTEGWNDTIDISGTTSDSLFDAGAGNDIINIKGGNNNEVIGGTGSDTYNVTWTLGNKLEINNKDYKNGDIDSINIKNYKSTDFTYRYNDKVLLLTDAQHGTITIDLAGDLDNTLNFKGITFADGFKSSAEIKEQLQTGPTDVMKTFMTALDTTEKSGTAAVDEAIAACSKGKYASLASLIADFKGKYLADSGNTVGDEKAFLYKYCGIDLDNEDTGAISGKDAGGVIAKDADSIVNDKLTVADFQYNTDKYKTIQAKDYSGCINGSATDATEKSFYSTVVNGITLYWNESNWQDLGTDVTVLKQIMGGLINSWAESALNLIKDSYGMTMEQLGTLLNKLNNGTYGLQICFENKPDSDKVAYLWNQNDVTGTLEGDKYVQKTTGVSEVLVINTAYYQDMLTNVSGNSSKGQIYLDRLLAHELVHGVMAANVNDFNNLPNFVKEGLAELLHGADDSRKQDILDFVNTSETQLWDLVYGDDILSDQSYSGGYLLFRYLVKQVLDADKTITELRNNVININSQTANTDITAVKATDGVAENNSIMMWNGQVGTLKAVEAKGLASAVNNTVNVSGGILGSSIEGSIYGAQVEGGQAKGNSVSIGTAKEKFDSSLKDVYAAYSDSGAVSYNSVSIYGSGTSNTVNSIYGGYSIKGDVMNNKVMLTDIMVNERVYGGYSESGNVSNNTVITNGSQFFKFSEGPEGYGPSYAGSMFLHETYGGYSVNGNVSNNKVLLKNSLIEGALYGGKSVNGNVTANSVEICNVQTTDLYGAYVVGSADKKGIAKDNQVTITGEVYISSAYGVFVENGDAINNTMTIDGNNKYSFNQLYGTLVEYGDASGNVLNVKNTISDGLTGVCLGNISIDRYIYGKGNASNNTVFVEDCQMTSNGSIWGVTTNSEDAKIDHNMVNVKNTKLTGSVCGARSNSISEYNYVSVENTTLGQVMGADSNESNFNSVYLKNVTMEAGKDYTGVSDNNIYGARGSSCKGNKVVIENSNLLADVYGAKATFDEIYYNKTGASNNAVIIYSGNIKGNVYGGYTYYAGMNNTAADNNTVNIYGGTIGGNVYGGCAIYDGSENNNTITVMGNALIKGSIEGGRGNDTITIGSTNAAKVNANDGDDLIYIKSRGNTIDGGAGLDSYVLDWEQADGNTITDTNESANVLKLANAKDLTIAKSGEGLLIKDAKQSLTITDASSIATIELLGTDTKVSYNIKAALSSITDAATSFTSGLASFAKTSAMGAEDKKQLTFVTGNI